MTGAYVICVKGVSAVFLTGGTVTQTQDNYCQGRRMINLLPYCVCHFDLWHGT